MTWPVWLQWFLIGLGCAAGPAAALAILILLARGWRAW